MRPCATCNDLLADKSRANELTPLKWARKGYPGLVRFSGLDSVSRSAELTPKPAVYAQAESKRSVQVKRHAMEQLAILRINLELRQNLNKAEQKLVMNLSPVYEQWRAATLQEGEAIGRQQGEAIGEARGRQQGEASLVIRLLTRRFQQDLSAAIE